MTVDQVHPDAHSESMGGFGDSSTDLCALGVCICKEGGGGGGIPPTQSCISSLGMAAAYQMGGYAPMRNSFPAPPPGPGPLPYSAPHGPPPGPYGAPYDYNGPYEGGPHAYSHAAPSPAGSPGGAGEAAVVGESGMSPIGKLIPMHRRFHSRGWTALPQFEIAFLPFDAQGLRAQILNSPHLRDNPLNDLFDGSKGIYFNFAAQGPAYERFQAACPWLDAMYRQMRHHPQANAFVLNALVLPVGTPAQVALRTCLRLVCACLYVPVCVSVYVHVNIFASTTLVLVTLHGGSVYV